MTNPSRHRVAQAIQQDNVRKMVNREVKKYLESVPLHKQMAVGTVAAALINACYKYKS